MKFTVSVIIIALLSLVTGLYFPWWSLAIVAFLVSALVHQKAGRAFGAGFLAIFLLWGGLAFWMDLKNNHILSQRIAQLLPLGGNSWALILLTATLGALVAGFSAMAGSYLRSSR